jgi:para-aminobenzoate synthetase component 2
MSERPTILVVDNYDSFVYNLVQYVGELGAQVSVHRNDTIDAGDVAHAKPAGVVISPGPGHPRDAGNCLDIIRYCAEGAVPVLGVCLGHQALAAAFGGAVIAAPELLHGRASVVQHDGRGVFARVASPLIVGRYHSLVVDDETLPDSFEVSGRSNGLIMAMRHRELDLEGVQFHPESVLTQDGYLIVANWLEGCGVGGALVRAKELSHRADEVRASLPRPNGA